MFYIHFQEQESISVGCVWPARSLYPILSKVPSGWVTLPFWAYPPIHPPRVHTHPLGHTNPHQGPYARDTHPPKRHGTRDTHPRSFAGRNKTDETSPHRGKGAPELFYVDSSLVVGNVQESVCVNFTKRSLNISRMALSARLVQQGQIKLSRRKV